MSRQAYPKYKSSGVVWFGYIPEHWDVKRAKGLLARNEGGVWGEDFDDDGVIVLRSTEQTVDGEWNIVEPARRRLTSTEYASCRLQAGDLVVTKSSGSSLHIGKTSIVTKEVEVLDCCYSNFMQRLRVKRTAEPRFMWYVLNGELGRKQFDYYSSTTTGLANLNGSIIGNVGMAVPPLDEQKAIAAFLDRETARIDALIKKKQRQIELLQEKRSALISHAVTKGLPAAAAAQAGLNPNVQMKDSGVEWLGEIPEHWEVKRLKHVVRCLDGHRIPLNAEQRGQVQGEYPYWGANGIVDHLSEWIFNEELVLLGEDGAPFFERFKDVAFFVNGKVWVNNHIHVLRPQRGIDPRYLVHILNITDYAAFIEGTTRDKLTQDKMNNIPVLFSPVNEQRAIAAFLDLETARIDALVEKISKSIDLLLEYRTALISAAVTGKIDGRKGVA